MLSGLTAEVPFEAFFSLRIQARRGLLSACAGYWMDMGVTYKAPVLVVGQGVHATGYARVIGSILGQLKDRYAFHHFAINYKGPVLDCGWKVYPNELPGDIFGVEQLPLLIERIRPRLLFFVHDMDLHWVNRSGMDKRRGEFKVVSYLPIEGPIAAPSAVKALAGLDRAVLFTEFARGEVEAAFGKLDPEPWSVRFPALEVIPHGVDISAFRPCSEGSTAGAVRSGRTKARKALFPDRPELADAFIVLNANRNQPRKRVDITIEAFALFAENKPERIKLYLHMGMEDRGYDVLELIRRHNLEGRALLTTEAAGMPNVADERLNLIYNACDVGLNTSTGEGWGLVAFEHAATGAAQVMPRHSACAELWKDGALLVTPIQSFRHPRDFVEHKVVSPVDVAEALDRIYQNPAGLRRLSEQAYKRATVPELQWKNIAARWDRLFQRELDQKIPGSQWPPFESTSNPPFDSCSAATLPTSEQLPKE
jgi:D-inositol-3-phosphate glycosyltransferase